MRFHRLVVLCHAGRSGIHHQFLCRCDCGAEKTIPGQSLLSGRTKSCGCYRRDRGKEISETGGTAVIKKHGLHGTPTHLVWMGMKRRCTTTHATPSRYARQGVTVCERWASSFEDFLADMGERPSPEHSIDRIDFTKGYEPGNCRWATNLEQASNKRNNRWIEFNGERKHLAEWARLCNMSVPTLRMRLETGWSVDDAFHKPVAKKRRHLPQTNPGHPVSS